MKYYTQNALYFRAFKGVTDPLAFQCSISMNRKALERKFYDNDLICSWSVKCSSDFQGDILYCKGIGENSVGSERVNILFSEFMDSFKLPKYDEYERFCSANNNSANISKRILDYLTGRRTEKLNRKEFDNELEQINRNIKNSFVDITSLDKSRYRIQTFSEHNDEDISDGKLAFMGGYYKTEVTDLRDILIYKLLEKYYGNGESDSIYSYYRGKGDTYLSLSGYSPDENIFYTGIMSGYSDSIYNDVLQRIRNMSFEQKRLDDVKKRLKNDICFSAFQFGEQLTVMPYVLHASHETTISRINDIIQDITIDELSEVSDVKMNSVKVVMQ